MVTKLDTALGLLASARNTFTDLAKDESEPDANAHRLAAMTINSILDDYYDI